VDHWHLTQKIHGIAIRENIAWDILIDVGRPATLIKIAGFILTRTASLQQLLADASQRNVSKTKIAKIHWECQYARDMMEPAPVVSR
jgi:hypothetical protein